MLTHLHLKHFTIISELSQEFSDGLTVLTGETGAGKSILLDALEIALGERADNTLIQQGVERCEITLTFAVQTILPAQHWLQEQDLYEEESNDCIIRRIINRDGPSRSSINGRPCSLQQLRELGGLLVHIHGQNKHSLLLKSAYQRQLLDEYAGLQNLCAQVQNCYEQWRQIQNKLEQINGRQSFDTQKDFLNFQLQEFRELAFTAQEWAQLQKEQQQLAHGEQWVSSCQTIMDILSEDEQHNAIKTLHNAQHHLQELSRQTQNADKINTALDCVNQASIQAQEAYLEVRNYLQTLESNPERLQEIEQRLAAIHEMARKHRINPEELLVKQQNLQAELDGLLHQDAEVETLKTQIQQQVQQYTQLADQLSQARRQAAEDLQQKITRQIHSLGIAHGEIAIQLTPYDPQDPHPFGNEHIDFLVRTNPGQAFQLLSKVASGGELSRMALAIQVVTVQENTLPTIIFDEVDVGVGGRTAQIVGEQLRKLAGNAQVLCVTHLPQVAAQGHQHLRIQKLVKKDCVNTVIQKLQAEERTQEIARMLGGVTITETTLAHAREMLGI